MPIKPRHNHLGSRQRAVINDILKNGLSEYEALEKNKVSPCRYRQWLKNRYFTEQLNARIDAVTTQRKLILVRSLPKAAEKLAQLTASEKDETARKACLDIISLQKADQEQEAAEKAEQAEDESHFPKISDAKASRMLAILAEDDDEEETSSEQPAPSIEQPAHSIEPVGAGLAPALDTTTCGTPGRGEPMCSPSSVCTVSSSAVREASGSNPEREAALKRYHEAQASIQRRNFNLKRY